MNKTAQPVWFISGCSSGFGEQLAHQVLASGGCVAATARDKSRLADLVKAKALAAAIRLCRFRKCAGLAG